MTIQEVLAEINKDVQYNDWLYNQGYSSQGQYLSNLEWLQRQRFKVMNDKNLQWEGQSLSPITTLKEDPLYVYNTTAGESASKTMGLGEGLLKVLLILVAVGIVVSIIRG